MARGDWCSSGGSGEGGAVVGGLVQWLGGIGEGGAVAGGLKSLTSSTHPCTTV